VTPPTETLVIGLGNVVMSDDGVGMHALARLRDRTSPADGIELIEGGTAGLLLLPHVADAQQAIIIDAIDMGAPAGALVRLDSDTWPAAFANKVSVHDVGLRDLLGAAQLTGALPQRLVLHGVQPATTSIGTELSAPVAGALDQLVNAVQEELAAWKASSSRTASLSAVACSPSAAEMEASACA
jgi:hydrogenase maturation protease